MSYSNLSDEEKELYLEVLREGTTPFDRFVSRGDIEDPVDIPNPRREMDRAVMSAIKQTMRDKTARFIPVIGTAGSGKTHAYWALKDKEKKLRETAKSGLEGRLEVGADSNWSVVYIPSPPTTVRILFHIYTCIINEIPNVIDRVSDYLVTKFGGRKKKGFFSKPDIDSVITAAASKYPGVFADCVKALIINGMHNDPSKRAFAKRWLLGEVIEEEEQEDLGVQSVIERDDVCLAMIKLITENLVLDDGTTISTEPPKNKVLVLYFDEFESPYRTYGPEAEERFLEILKRIYNEVKNVVIVAAILKEIWPRIMEVADKALRSRMEPHVELKPFSFGDVKLWFAKSQEHFWEENNLNPPLDPLFPLNEKVLRIIFERTYGNPREVIKLTREFVKKIVYGDLSLEDITEETRPEEIQMQAQETVMPSGKSEAERKIEAVIDKEGLIIDVNPATVIGAVLKGLQEIIAEQSSDGGQINVRLDYKFFVGQKEKNIGALVEFKGRKIGIDVPSVRSFDRSGGVAAYYSAKRLVDGLMNKTLDSAVIIIPESTSGAKTQYLFDNNPNLKAFKINQEQAKQLIQGALNPDIRFPKEAYEFIKLVTGLDLEPPPPPESENNTDAGVD
ncbi:MAG: hypothetical protein ACTSWN_08240 [Promethearchaeota archaeon]